MNQAERDGCGQIRLNSLGADPSPSGSHYLDMILGLSMAIIPRGGRAGGQGGPIMIASLRAGIVAALVALLSLSLTVAASAQKAFQRDDLADAAIKLEAQI